MWLSMWHGRIFIALINNHHFLWSGRVLAYGDYFCILIWNNWKWSKKGMMVFLTSSLPISFVFKLWLLFFVDFSVSIAI